MLLSVVTTAVVVAGAVVTGPPHDHAVRREAAAATVTSATPAARALAVLRAWDRRRATAWAADDAGALRALYLPGSRTGRRDVAMLTAYRRRGLRVTTMRRQVLSVRVRESAPRTLRVVVTDRLAEARVTGAGARTVLPRGSPGSHRIVLRRVRAGWRVDEVYDA